MIINLDEVRRGHRIFLADHRLLTDHELSDAGQHAVNYVYAYPTFKPRTGHLQRSTEWKLHRLANGRLVRIQNTAKYAQPIEYGARPHVIRPRRKKALRFIVRGKVAFAASVNHPGNKPYRFLYKATNSALRILHSGLSQGMSRLAAKF